MDWWHAAGLMGTFVLSVVGVMAFGWRMVENLRRENREAHAEIRGELTGVTRSVDTLRQDFRAHVLGSAGAGADRDTGLPGDTFGAPKTGLGVLTGRGEPDMDWKG